MSANTGFARFDTRTRTTQNDEQSEQIDFRTVGAREHGQLALNELAKGRAAGPKSRSSSKTQTKTTREPTRADLEAALGCARTTIDALREQVEQLEAERDQLRQEGEGNQ